MSLDDTALTWYNIGEKVRKHWEIFPVLFYLTYDGGMHRACGLAYTVPPFHLFRRLLPWGRVRPWHIRILNIKRWQHGNHQQEDQRVDAVRKSDGATFNAWHYMNKTGSDWNDVKEIEF